MKGRLLPIAAIVALALVIASCSQATPATTPTKAPATAPTAVAAVAPTMAPAVVPTKGAETQLAKVTFPEKGKSVAMIVPAEAGGGTDVGARVLVAPMEKSLGVSIQVINKPGASTQVGVTELAKSKPDGYTIGWTNLPNSMSPYLDPSRQCAYSRKDLVQVANVVIDPETFAVKADSKYKTIKDLIDDAKARPEEVKVGFSGILGPDHVFLLMFQEIAGVKFNLVNFAQGGQAHITAMLGGHVDANGITLGNYSAQVKAGSVRFLAIADDQCSQFPAIKDVPTLKEMGYSLSLSSSRGLCVPAGTSKDVVDILSDSVKKAVADPEVKKKFEEVLLTTRYMNADEYSRFWDDFEKQMKPIVDRELNKGKK